MMMTTLKRSGRFQIARSKASEGNGVSRSKCRAENVEIHTFHFNT
jgi:hypothetical protein